MKEPTTIHPQKRDSGPSSTEQISPTGSAVSKTDRAHCGRLFGWSTLVIAIRTSDFMPPPTPTTGKPRSTRYGCLDVCVKHPERIVGNVPTPPALPLATWINQPKEEATDSLIQ